MHYEPIDSRAEPKVAISFFVDKLSEPCQGKQIAVSYEWCWETLHRPLDWCGIESENDKQGGCVWDNCIYCKRDSRQSSCFRTLADFGVLSLDRVRGSFASLESALLWCLI